jgi:hypothetical protein
LRTRKHCRERLRIVQLQIDILAGSFPKCTYHPWLMRPEVLFGTALTIVCFVASLYAPEIRRGLKWPGQKIGTAIHGGYTAKYDGKKTGHGSTLELSGSNTTQAASQGTASVLARNSTRSGPELPNQLQCHLANTKIAGRRDLSKS